MENEKKENLFEIASMFVSIITSGTLFAGLGRFISGIELSSALVDGFFISLAIYLSLFFLNISFLENTKIHKYSILNSIITGFLIGGIPGIILNNKLIFYTSGISSALLCLSFNILEKYFDKKEANIVNLLSFYLLAGAAAGFIGNFIFSASIEFNLLQSSNMKVIFLGALYGAVWGGLIILGIKLSILYLKPLIKVIIPPVLVSLMHGIFIAAGTGIFGIIIETITYTNTNFDLTATGGTSLNQAIALSFLRDAGFGLYFGFLFSLPHNIISFKKIENPLYIFSGALAGFIASKIVQQSFLFILNPVSGLLLGIGIGLGIFVSNTLENDGKKSRVWALRLSPAFGFLALIISTFIKGTLNDQTIFYLLSLGILGAIYGFIIIFFKFVCDYYLETDSVKTHKLYINKL